MYEWEYIFSLSDNEKIELLGKLSNDMDKADVIMILQDDASKIEQLGKLSNDMSRLSVILTLKDDIIKIEGLKNLNDELAKLIVKSSLSDREKLKELFLDRNRTYTDIGLDKKITIGMEVESEGEMSNKIYELNRILKKEIDGKIRGWETKRDRSLVNGVEIVSPILTDNKEDIEDVYMLCEMLQKCGQKISPKCGGHIHIGADYLESKDAYINLFEIWGNTEKIIYKISNEKDNVPRFEVQKYAAPISSKLNEAINKETVNIESEEDLNLFIIDIQEVQKDRHSGLNLLNINNRKNTIEFRTPNGTINPDTWIENARLFGRIVQVSQKLAEIEKKSELTQEDRKLLDLKNDIKEEIPEQEKMEILLELLFTQEEKNVYRERYLSSTKILEQLPQEGNPFQEIEFSQVDFKNKKHSLCEFNEVAISSRIESINEVTRETVHAVRTEELEHSKDMEER